MMVRIRAFPSGTVGYVMPVPKTPSLNSSREKSMVSLPSPMMIGVIGVSLGGATVEPDNDANHRLYDKTLTATDIVRGKDVKPAGEGETLVQVLDTKLTKHGD